MVLVVDFNMVRSDGRLPALLPPDQAAALAPGAKVVAADGEGTECWAVIDEVRDNGLAYLTPVDGTTRRDSDLRPNVQDLFA